MNHSRLPETHFHGPDNAEHELHKAYNEVIESAVTHFWDRKAIPGVNPHEVITIYKHAFQAHRNGNALASERWARSAKHLARAFWSEAKIAYLEPRATELPFIDGATPEELGLHERSDTTVDLLDSVAQTLPPGCTEMPEDLARYVARARKHLLALDREGYHHALLRAERIKAAHEYGRTVECMALAYEAESQPKESAA